MKIAVIFVAIALTGCVSTNAKKPEQTMTAEEALGTFFLISALGGKGDLPDVLATIYPLRSQIVTFAMIGFHRDRGAWPTSLEELSAYAVSSPANPKIPEGALTGLEVQKKEDGGIVYSTLEDRQRGREFSISSSYRVSFQVPSYAFASSASTTAPVSHNSTIGFDWGQIIAEAIVRAASMQK